VPRAALAVLGGAGILVAAAAAWLLLSHRERRVAQPAAPDKVIVEVGPFVEAAGSTGHDHIGQGLTETLTDDLNRLPRLRLIRATLPAGGSPAGARFALSGTFTAGPDRLSVTARLVKAGGGPPTRVIEVSRPAGDVYGALREIGAGVTEALEISAPAGGWEALFPDKAAFPEAVDAYFRGRSLAAQGGGANLEKAVEFLEQAARRDPPWAGAHAALANAYISLGGESLWAPSKAFPAALKSAGEALRLEPGLGEARLASAQLKWRSDWDYAAAEREYREAVRVAPEQPEIRRCFGLFLSSLGRHEEAQAEIRAALEIEPGASRAASALGLVLYFARLYDQAEIELENARQARPADQEPCLGLGLLHLQTREFGESLGMLQRAALLGGDPLELNLRAGIVLAHLGRRQDVGKLLGEAIQASRRRYVSSASLAAVYAALIEPDQAQACLDKALEERDASLVFLKVSPLFDPLRGESWFAGLLQKAGF